MKTVVLHGFSGNAVGLETFVAALQLEGAVAIDMPGFGGNRRPYDKNWQSYVAAVHATIVSEVGAGEKLHIIGHSHGAMVAFCLAAWYPDMVGRLTLICPVAKGGLVAKMFLILSSGIAKLIGKKNVVRLLSVRWAVDAITYLSKRDCKDEAAYRALQAARRKEAELYSVEMLSLLDIIKLFEAECGGIVVSVPARIVVADNDLLVSKNDIAWYRAHLRAPEMKRIPGGHVAPVTQTEACALACSRI